MADVSLELMASFSLFFNIPTIEVIIRISRFKMKQRVSSPVIAGLAASVPCHHPLRVIGRIRKSLEMLLLPCSTRFFSFLHHFLLPCKLIFKFFIPLLNLCKPAFHHFLLPCKLIFKFYIPLLNLCKPAFHHFLLPCKLIFKFFILLLHLSKLAIPRVSTSNMQLFDFLKGFLQSCNFWLHWW